MQQGQTVHPSFEQLAAFGWGRLPAEEAADIECHVAACRECCAVVEALPDNAMITLLRGLPAAPAIASEEESLLARPLGDYRLLREIDRGGMGIVFEAEQLSLRRRVAVKVLPLAATFDAKQLQRFKNEAQAAAHLQHRNIVPIYAVGCDHGVHYYAMQLIQGRTLAALTQELRRQAGLDTDAAQACQTALAFAPPTGGKQMPPPAENPATSPATAGVSHSTYGSAAYFRAAAELGVQAAEALDHAHQLGVIHRDIKPANLLVKGGPGLVTGMHLWIADFGLARILYDPHVTATGHFLGTLRYMSPEQILAGHGLVDHRTDIYSLGATLYELLTLEPAVRGRDREHMLHQMVSEETTSPRRINRAIPVDLETIVQKAMAKALEERYASAQELANDLRRFLDDQPIRAKPPTVAQRLRKWARRHQAILVTTGVFAFALMACATLLLILHDRRMAKEQRRTKEEQYKTEVALHRERQTLYLHRVALAHRDWLANNILQAEALLDGCPPEFRRWEWHYLKRLCRPEMTIMQSHRLTVWGLAFSPDGTRLASGGGDANVELWDPNTGQRIRTLSGHNNPVRAVAFSRDGKLLASAGGTMSLVPQNPPYPPRQAR